MSSHRERVCIFELQDRDGEDNMININVTKTDS